MNWTAIEEWISVAIAAKQWHYLTIPSAAIAAVTAFLASVYGLLKILAEIKDLWDEKLRPQAYRPEQRARAKARARFAKHLTVEIVAKNLAENWQDAEFVELEAEVEADGR